MHYLDFLESESIYILREAAAQFRNATILFSGGKDSACIVHLARKAFFPCKIPFSLLHVDTGHNFPEALLFRDQVAANSKTKLLIAHVEETIRRGRAQESKGSRNALQSITLMEAISEFQFDALIGGARRDEEKARAKERVFSLRDEFGTWNPKNQRPELWSVYNGRVSPGQHMRVFPISNWTELDVWNYIKRENIALPSLYFSHRRQVIKKKNGALLAHAPFIPLTNEDETTELTVRCRTVGDMTCTGLIESTASTINEILREIPTMRTTERGTRTDDQTSDTSMEDRKMNGYF